MASVTEKTAAAYLQRMYSSIEEDKFRDFELVSKDGETFKVHSIILQFRYILSVDY